MATESDGRIWRGRRYWDQVDRRRVMIVDREERVITLEQGGIVI